MMCIAVDLDKAFDFAEKIIIYNDGSTAEYYVGEEKFDIILDGWKNMIEFAHDMPAFGVSLNAATLEEMKVGQWVEFVFETKYESNGMPFDKLLVNVKKYYQGFNIIRYNIENGYDGRCFYYDLNGKDMSDFHDILNNL